MTGENRWIPILEGAAAERALEAVGSIADSLRDPKNAEVEGWSLGAGPSGIALLFGYRAQAARDESEAESDAEVAVAYVTQALQAVADTPQGPSLYGGLSGVAWTAQHLKGRLLDDEDVEEICEVVDRMVLGLLAESPWEFDYDLISGLVGFGVYFLERLPGPAAVEALERIVDHLTALAVSTDAGLTWLSRPELLSERQRELTPEGHYNLGVAHGVPGVIALLSELFARGVAAERARTLLEGAVPWLLSQKQPPGLGSVFSSWVGPGLESGRTRVAWCYGDLGLSTTLLLAARCVRAPAWEREAIEIAKAVARVRWEDSGVMDTALCHGAAGNAHLFNRLFQATRDPELEAAARFWFDKTLELRKPGEGVGGYLNWTVVPDTRRGPNPEFRWNPEPGFLTGAAGIGLALLSAACPLEPSWDRVLLAGVPPR
jgi:lantibiotic modifying enzyme